MYATILKMGYEKIMSSYKRFFEQYRDFFPIILFFVFPVKEKKAAAFAAAQDYFLRKDLQSVHWSTVGFSSWVPTKIRSREQ